MNVRTVCILTSVSPMFLIFYFFMLECLSSFVCFCSMFFKFCTTSSTPPFVCALTLPVPLLFSSPPSLHRMQYAPICLSINALFAMRMTLGRGGEWTTRSLWDDATWVAADPENTLIPTFLPHSKPAVTFYITFLLIFLFFGDIIIFFFITIPSYHLHGSKNLACVRACCTCCFCVL